MRVIVTCEKCFYREKINTVSTSLWKNERIKALKENGECRGWSCPDCGCPTLLIKPKS